MMRRLLHLLTINIIIIKIISGREIKQNQDSFEIRNYVNTIFGDLRRDMLLRASNLEQKYNEINRIKNLKYDGNLDIPCLHTLYPINRRISFGIGNKVTFPLNMNFKTHIESAPNNREDIKSEISPEPLLVENNVNKINSGDGIFRTSDLNAPNNVNDIKPNFYPIHRRLYPETIYKPHEFVPMNSYSYQQLNKNLNTLFKTSSKSDVIVTETKNVKTDTNNILDGIVNAGQSISLNGYNRQNNNKILKPLQIPNRNLHNSKYTYKQTDSKRPNKFVIVKIGNEQQQKPKGLTDLFENNVTEIEKIPNLLHSNSNNFGNIILPIDSETENNFNMNYVYIPPVAQLIPTIRKYDDVVVSNNKNDGEDANILVSFNELKDYSANDFVTTEETPSVIEENDFNESKIILSERDQIVFKPNDYYNTNVSNNNDVGEDAKPVLSYNESKNVSANYSVTTEQVPFGNANSFNESDVILSNGDQFEFLSGDKNISSILQGIDQAIVSNKNEVRDDANPFVFLNVLKNYSANDFPATKDVSYGKAENHLNVRKYDKVIVGKNKEFGEDAKPFLSHNEGKKFSANDSVTTEEVGNAENRFNKSDIILSHEDEFAFLTKDKDISSIVREYDKAILSNKNEVEDDAKSFVSLHDLQNDSMTTEDSSFGNTDQSLNESEIISNGDQFPPIDDKFISLTVRDYDDTIVSKEVGEVVKPSVFFNKFKYNLAKDSITTEKVPSGKAKNSLKSGINLSNEEQFIIENEDIYTSGPEQNNRGDIPEY